MPFVPIDEMQPDYERRLDEQIRSTPPPGQDVLEEQQRRAREIAEARQREAQAAMLDQTIQALPPPGEAERAQQAAVLDRMAQAGASAFAPPPAPAQAPATAGGQDAGSFGPPASDTVAPVAADLGVTAPPAGALGQAQAGPTPPTDDGSSVLGPPAPPPADEGIPVMRGLTSLYDQAAGIVAPAVRSAGDLMTRMDQPGTESLSGGRLGEMGGALASVGQQPFFAAARAGLEGGNPLEAGKRALDVVETRMRGPDAQPSGLFYQPVEHPEDEQPTRFEDVLAAGGMEEGPTRRVLGTVGDVTLDLANFLPIGLGGKYATANEGLQAAIRAGASEEVISQLRGVAAREAVKETVKQGIGAGIGGGLAQAGTEAAVGALGGDENAQAIAGGLAGMVGGGIGAGLAEGAGRRARDVGEWLARNGPADESLGAVADRTPSRLMDQLAAGERVNPTEVLDRANEIDFISADDAAKALGDAAAGPGKMPSYLNAVQDFMLAQRQKTIDGQLTPRDVAKAYAMTLSSIGAAEINRETAERAFGPVADRFVQPSSTGRPSVRPEEAAASWLFGEQGQRALDAIDRGEVDQEAWQDLINRRRSYGRSGLEYTSTAGKTPSSFFSAPKRGQFNLTNIGEMTDQLNAAHGDLAQMDRIIKKAYGIGEGKVGFVKSLLGFGDTPTFDAVELNFWLTGQGDISRLDTREANVARAIKGQQVVGEGGRRTSVGGYLQDPRISAALRDKLLGRIGELQDAGLGQDIDPSLAAHIMHHWIWDKAKGVVTTHEGMMDAQRNALADLPRASVGEVARMGAGALAGAGISQTGTDEDTPLGERITRGVIGAEAGVRAGRNAPALARAGISALERVGEAARVRPLSERAQTLMDAYAEHGPRWQQEIRDQAPQIAASTQFTPKQAAKALPMIRDAMQVIEDRLPDTKMVVTNVSDQQIANAIDHGTFLSKFDALDDPEAVNAATERVVGGERFDTPQAKAYEGTPSIPTDRDPETGATLGATPEDFVRRERAADQMVLGDTDTSRVYARVTEGQPLADEQRGVYVVWDDGTPRVTALHHHFAHAAPDYPLHAGMAPGYKQALWRDPDLLDKIDLGDGRTIADTPWTVGPQQENTLRAASLVMTMPAEAKQMLLRGEIGTPEQLADAIMRGQKRQDQPLVRYATEAPEKGGLGLPKSEDDEFGLAGSRNQNRSEALVVEPDLGNIKAIYVPATPREMAKPTGKKRSGGLFTPTDRANRLADAVEAATGRRPPVIDHVLEPGGDKVIPEVLSPGRRGIVERTQRMGMKNIGGFATGAALGGATDDDQGDPWDPDHLSRMALTGVIGALAPQPGFKRTPERERLLQSFYGASKRGPITRDAIRAHSFGDAVTRALFDRNVHLNNLVDAVQRDLGRPLQPEERADLLVRVNPDKQAEVFARERLRPIVQSVDEQGLRPALEEYLTYHDNIDKADAVGERVAKRKAPADAKPSRWTGPLQEAKDDVARIERMAQDDPETLGIREELSKAKRRVKTLQSRVANDIQSDMQRVEEGSLAAAVAGREARDTRRFSGGLDRAATSRALANLEQELGPEKFRAVEEAADQIHAMMHDLVDMKVEAGVFSPELAADLKEKFPNYIPTKILDYMTEQSDRLGQGRKIGLTDRGLRALTDEGTIRARETPLASVLRYVYDTHTQVARNDAFNAFARLADLRGAQNARSIIRPVVDDARWERLVEANKLPEGAIRASAAKTNEWVPVQGFTDGVVKRYAVHNTIADVVKMAETQSSPRALQVLMGLYKALQTSLSPLFLASNAALDAVAYTLRESTRAGGPQHIPGIVADLGRAYWEELSALARGDLSESTKAFYAAGGGQSGDSLMSRGAAVRRWGESEADFAQRLGRQRIDTLTRGRSYDTVREAIPGRFKDSLHEVSSVGGLLNVAKQFATMRPVQAIGSHIEAAPRNASFRRAQRAGRGDLQAMINGRTVTIDFAQGGTFAKLVNQFVPFFNVGLQGAATLPRTIREGRQLYGNDRAALGTVAATLIAPMVAAEAWNNADEQRKADYADVPDYVKDQGIVIMWPTEAPVDERTGDRRPQYTLLRLREFAPFAIMGREVFNRVTGQAEGRDLLPLVTSSWNALSPVAADNATDFFSSLNPFVLPNTGLQLALNKDFFRGGDIATDFNDQRASALAKGVAGGINKVGETIGNTALQDVRPSQVEFAGQDVGGGVYRTYGAASDLASRAAGGEDLNQSGTVEDIPVVGGVARRFGGSAVGGNLQRAQAEVDASPLARLARAEGISWRPTPAGTTVNGVRLTRALAAGYQRAVNEYAAEEADRLESSAAYDAATPDRKQQMLQDALARARQRAAGEVRSDPDYRDLAGMLQDRIESVGR